MQRLPEPAVPVSKLRAWLEERSMKRKRTNPDDSS
jgi:hypothetical protein